MPAGPRVLPRQRDPWGCKQVKNDQYLDTIDTLRINTIPSSTEDNLEKRSRLRKLQRISVNSNLPSSATTASSTSTYSCAATSSFRKYKPFQIFTIEQGIFINMFAWFSQKKFNLRKFGLTLLKHGKIINIDKSHNIYLVAHGLKVLLFVAPI